MLQNHESFRCCRDQIESYSTPLSNEKAQTAIDDVFLKRQWVKTTGVSRLEKQRAADKANSRILTS